MTDSQDIAARRVAEKIAIAREKKRPLCVVGRGSKAFYGAQPASRGEELSTAELSGVIAYEPGELFVTAAAGVPLSELAALLADRGQMLPFDPPQFGGDGSFGGAIAAGLPGPGRPHYGGVRDSMLGARIVNGAGELLAFGGQVMKNVAGYDISRLTAGALGTLGVIVSATVKVLPRPPETRSRILSLPPEAAVAAVNKRIAEGLPIVASFYDGENLRIRLAGRAAAAAAARIGGESAAGEDDDFWRDARDHRLPFFADNGESLWRLSLPPTAEVAAAMGGGVFEWHGGLYWRRGGDDWFGKAARLGGSAQLFRRGKGDEKTPFLPPQPPPLARLSRRLKRALDPDGVLNPGRLYPEF